MRARAKLPSVALLLGFALGLNACAQRPPEAPAAAARSLEPPAAKPLKLAKAKRADPNCSATRVELSSERKEELFRQFEAEMGPSVPADVVADPAPVPRCKQASK